MKTRRIIILLAALSGILGCVRQLEPIDQPGDSVIFKAVNGDNLETKTVLQNDGTIVWSAADEINLFYGSGHSTKFTSTNTSPASEADFKGSLDGFEYNETDSFWAAYPYNEANTCDGSSVTVTLPAEQTAIAGTFADDLFIGVARTKDFNLRFFNVCGGIKFSVTTEGVRSVVLKGKGGEVLAGTAKVSFGEDGKPIVREVTNPKTEIKVSVPEGTSFEVGKWYYLVSLPVSLQNGFFFTLEKPNGSNAIREYDRTVAVKRSIWGVLKESDEALEYSEIDADKTQYEVSAGGGPVEIAVQTNVEMAVSTDAEWIHYTETKALSAKTIVLSVDKNESTESREGTVTIKQKNGSLKCDVKLIQTGYIAVSSIDLNQTTLYLRSGESETLSASVLPENATDKAVTWESSDASIATIDKEGKVTAIAEGTTTVTAKAGNKTKECKVVVNDKPVHYLKFTAPATAKLVAHVRSNTPIYFFSYDGTNWTQWDYSELIFSDAQPLYICGDNKEGINIAIKEDYLNSSHCLFGVTGTDVKCEGNIMSLLDATRELTDIPNSGCFYGLFWGAEGLISAPDLPATGLTDHCYEYMFCGTSLMVAPELPATTLKGYCYASMFAGCASLVDAPELPAKTLEYNCYESMFDHCINLSVAPELPATTLAMCCYKEMFSGCTSLTVAPELPALTMVDRCYAGMFSSSGLVSAPKLLATKLDSYCYSKMFEDCTNLTQAPSLPATSLASGCYDGMFSYCTSLADAPELPALTLASNCYDSMFRNCTKLTVAPDLPATTVNSYCYECMFEECTALTTAPMLPATNLERCKGCYSSMFAGCISLASAPDLPATVLCDQCYYTMFWGCSNLTTAPELPAMTLEPECYNYMFYGCEKINYIKCLATERSMGTDFNYTYAWLGAVYPVGTFVKKKGATWSSGVNGIPVGWTVEEVE